MELAEILWVFKVFVVQKLKKRPFKWIFVSIVYTSKTHVLGMYSIRR